MYQIKDSQRMTLQIPSSCTIAGVDPVMKSKHALVWEKLGKSKYDEQKVVSVVPIFLIDETAMRTVEKSFSMSFASCR